MEQRDIELIAENRKTNYNLDKLMKEHDALEAKINQLEAAKGLGTQDEKELHKLKKDKLAGRDKIEHILAELR